MGRYHTGVTLIDNLLSLDITKLRQWGYLKVGVFYKGVISWSVRGEKIGEIAFTNHINVDDAYINLIYNYKDERKEVRINLIKVQSNLGKGFYWYFECPKTLKKCRKLYQYKGDFVHREVCKFAMYESQKRSKKERLLERHYGDYFNQDKIYKEYNRKHRKRSYKGIPTKREQELIVKLHNANTVDYSDIERILMFGV